MAWVAILHPHPHPLHQGILLFCFILLSYLTSGVFSGCKLFLLKQHIFLILTQPSWDGYLLLYSPKSIFRGILTMCLTGIATPSRVYLIDTGNEGHARDSRTP